MTKKIDYDYLGFNTWLESQGFANLPTDGLIRTSTARGATADPTYAIEVTNQRVGAIGISIQGRYTGVRSIE